MRAPPPLMFSQHPDVLLSLTTGTIKYNLCNYLNLSLLLAFNQFAGRSESGFCPEISHKIFSCEADAILEPKPFK